MSSSPAAATASTDDDNHDRAGAASPPVKVAQTNAAVSQQLAPQPGRDFSAAPPAG